MATSTSCASSRDASGALHILIADIKSSTSAKVEHRLQVAFYSEMVAALLADAGIAVDRIDLGILYRGPSDDAPPATASDRDRRDLERAQARDLLGVEDGLLELVVDAEAYRASVRDLVTGEHSTSAGLRMSRLPPSRSTSPTSAMAASTTSSA